MGRELVRRGNASRFEGSREDLRVDAVRLAAVLPDAQLLDARGVDDRDLMAVPFERVTHVPRLAAGLEDDVRRRRVGTENVHELIQIVHGPTCDNLALIHFAERDLSNAHIESYSPHRRPLRGSTF